MANPLFKADSFIIREGAAGEAMTLDGTINKTFILLALCVLGAAVTWSQPALAGLALPAILAAAVLGFVAIFRKRASPWIAPLYAILEGVALGAISLGFERAFPGIVRHAALLTFGLLGVLLVAYKSRIVTVGRSFRAGVGAATAAICVAYLADLVLMFFGHRVPLIHETGALGIGFSLVVTGVAAANLLLDFDFIENGVEGHSPKYMEWYAAFSLLVTLVWVYMEILRLLGKLQKR